MQGSFAEQVEALQARKTQLSGVLSGNKLTEAAREAMNQEFVLLTRAVVALTRIERHSVETAVAAAAAATADLTTATTPAPTTMQPGMESDGSDSSEPLE